MASLRRRLWAFAAVLLVAGTGIAVALVLAGGENGRPKESRPVGPSLDNLEPAWTATIDGAGILGSEFVQAGGVLVASTDHGLFAYDKDCGTGGEECDPLWTADIPTTDPAPAVSEGIVFEATQQGLFAFELDCGSGGAACEPLWIGPVPSDSNAAFEPVVSGDVVKVNYSLGEGRHHEVHAVAFPHACDADEGACEPLWTALVGEGTAFLPAPAVAGRFFQQVGSTLVGIDPGCGTGGDLCEPSFVWRTSRAGISGPVRGGEELLVGSENGSVHALPMDCPPEPPCRALWSGETGGYIATPPVVSTDKAFVAAGPTLRAFPLGCRSDGGECSPEWTAGAEGVDLLGTAHADERVVVAVSLKGPGSILAFPSECEQPCRPLWTAETDGRLGRVKVVGGKVFAGTYDGEVLVYPAACTEDGSECPASWSATVPGRISELFVDDSGVYVVSWGGDGLPRRQGTITAFRE